MSTHASLLPARTPRSAFGKLLQSETKVAWRVPLGLVLGVAVPVLRHPSDVAGALYQSDDLIRRPLRIEGGYTYPPEGPGLGVEPDWDRIEDYRLRG